MEEFTLTIKIYTWHFDVTPGIEPEVIAITEMAGWKKKNIHENKLSLIWKILVWKYLHGVLILFSV